MSVLVLPSKCSPYYKQLCTTHAAKTPKIKETKKGRVHAGSQPVTGELFLHTDGLNSLTEYRDRMKQRTRCKSGHENGEFTTEQ